MSRFQMNVVRGRGVAAVLGIIAGLCGPLGVSHGIAQQPAPAVELSLAQCIQIGMNNQAAIRVQMAGAAAAQQQVAVAQSYFYPQIDAQSRFTNASSIYTVALPNPITGPLGDIVADSGAYFGIAKQAGSAAAQAAIDNPNVSVAPGLPSFNAARQAVLNSLPATYDVDLLGQNFLTTEITMVQPLWTGGKIRYRRDQAELGAKAAQYDVERARQETTYNITRAYLSILLAGEMFNVADDMAGRYRAIESLTRNLVDSGNRYVTAADTYRAGSLRYLAESEKAGLERIRQRAYAGLRLAMGIDQQNDIQVADQRLLIGERQLDANSLLREAYARRPDLAKAEVGAQVAALERQIAQAAYCPDVGAFASFSNIWDDGHFANPTHPNEGAVGVGVQIPLFVGGRRGAESRQADCRQAQATQIRRLLANLVSQETQDAYLEYLQTSQQLHLEATAVHQASEALKILETRDVEDRDRPKNFEDQILTLQTMTQALVRYYQSVYNCNMALARIRFVTACDDYQTFVESGGTNARLGDDVAGRAPDASRR
jgi:outer membrane protein TolC